ncbi:MAG: carbon starvation CstA family protein [Candidatus Omnitrophica bacterium]|nr:carbon starvation CstA family protein [Candidatus Omnitrophota bacterium]
MNLLTLVLLSIALLFLGYFLYGSVLARALGLNREAITPANRFRDNMDFVPAGKFYLLGQHLSAIAAAGPIVGPIIAGLWFGWLPTIIWIIFGGIFIGGVHDFSALTASMKHQGKSIAEVIKASMSGRAFILFLLFLWFSLVYIITAFCDITASTFADKLNGPAVASSSMMYLGLAVIMGQTIRKLKLSVGISTLIFLPLVFVSIYLGPGLPLMVPGIFGMNTRMTWDMALLIYCFIASVIPVWMLLQPRGYLGGFFLSFTAGLSFLGIVIGSFTQNLMIQFPAFKGWVNPEGLPLFPILFTTVACGACSGFHSIVASGTTSKQISRETDAKLIGYGGMLLESFVAIIALSALLVISNARASELQDPSHIFANGIAVFLGSLGINKAFAFNFALLAFATFVYDTLDVATRLGRYVFQELTGWKGRLSAYGATFATLILPFIFVTREIKDPQGNIIPAWKLFWTVFGSSNQLLAALVLLGISVWLFKEKRRHLLTLLPSIFMMLVAAVSLLFILKTGLLTPMGITGSILLILAILLIIEAAASFARKS